MSKLFCDATNWYGLYTSTLILIIYIEKTMTISIWFNTSLHYNTTHCHSPLIDGKALQSSKRWHFYPLINSEGLHVIELIGGDVNYKTKTMINLPTKQNDREELRSINCSLYDNKNQALLSSMWLLHSKSTQLLLDYQFN